MIPTNTIAGMMAPTLLPLAEAYNAGRLSGIKASGKKKKDEPKKDGNDDRTSPVGGLNEIARIFSQMQRDAAQRRITNPAYEATERANRAINAGPFGGRNPERTRDIDARRRAMNVVSNRGRTSKQKARDEKFRNEVRARNAAKNQSSEEEPAKYQRPTYEVPEDEMTGAVDVYNDEMYDRLTSGMGQGIGTEAPPTPATPATPPTPVTPPAEGYFTPDMAEGGVFPPSYPTPENASPLAGVFGLPPNPLTAFNPMAARYQGGQPVRQGNPFGLPTGFVEPGLEGMQRRYGMGYPQQGAYVGFGRNPIADIPNATGFVPYPGHFRAPGIR